MPIFDLPLPELRRYRPDVTEPADFDDFWRRTLAEVGEHPLGVTSSKVPTRLALVDTYDVSFAGFGGQPVRAWLTVPAGTREPLPAVVQYHGYSGGRGLPHMATAYALAGWAHVSMDTRGQGWSTGGGSSTPDLTAEAGLTHAAGFMTAGITDPHAYYYRRVYTDALRVLQAAREHPLVDPDRVGVTGASQGGGISIAAAGLAAMAGIELAGVATDVPFLCHFARALEIAGDGPYLEIIRYLAGWRDHADAAYATLGYVDGVNLARRATAPALFSVGLMDPICPPSTVFAAFNHYGGGRSVDKDIVVYPHNEHEGGEDYQMAARLEWFAGSFAA